MKKIFHITLCLGMFGAGVFAETFRRDVASLFMQHARYYYEVEEIFGVSVPGYVVEEIDWINFKRTKKGFYTVVIKGNGWRIKKKGYNGRAVFLDALEHFRKHRTKERKPFKIKEA